MLTAEEKSILGIMVDMGQLRGAERVSAGSDDKIARELIEGFRAQMTHILPMQLKNSESQFARIQEEHQRLLDTMQALGITLTKIE